MPDEWKHQDETMEDLQLGGLKLLQKTGGFRFGMDSVLLAHFAAIRPKDTVIDFGTGTGILPLLLIGRGKGSVFHAVEIQPDYCEMAERTMNMNHLMRLSAIRRTEYRERCLPVLFPTGQRHGTSLKVPCVLFSFPHSAF